MRLAPAPPCAGLRRASVRDQRTTGPEDQPDLRKEKRQSQTQEKKHLDPSNLKKHKTKSVTRVPCRIGIALGWTAPPCKLGGLSCVLCVGGTIWHNATRKGSVLLQDSVTLVLSHRPLVAGQVHSPQAQRAVALQNMSAIPRKKHRSCACSYAAVMPTTITQQLLPDSPPESCIVQGLPGSHQRWRQRACPDGDSRSPPQPSDALCRCVASRCIKVRGSSQEEDPYVTTCELFLYKQVTSRQKHFVIRACISRLLVRSRLWCQIVAHLWHGCARSLVTAFEKQLLHVQAHANLLELSHIGCRPF